jgi:streptogramin lyase
MKNSAIWFTDARTNSIGKLDTRNGSMQLITIPTQNAGPMGVALAPDGKSIWFTEIMGDKIAQVDIKSMKITEYPFSRG